MSQGFKKLVADIFEVAAIALVDKLEGAFAEKLQGMSLDEIVALRGGAAAGSTKTGGRRPGKGKRPTNASGRLPRRSAEEVEAVIAKVAKFLAGKPDGVGAGEIREKLNIDKRELPRVIKQGVKSGVLRIVSGQKRSTMYGAGKGKPASKTKARPAKRTAKRATTKPAKTKARSARAKSASKPAKKTGGKKAKKAPAAPVAAEQPSGHASEANGVEEPAVPSMLAGAPPASPAAG